MNTQATSTNSNSLAARAIELLEDKEKYLEASPEEREIADIFGRMVQEEVENIQREHRS